MLADYQVAPRRSPMIILHDHLDGGLRAATLSELAERVGHDLPAATPDALARHIVDRCTGRGLVGYGEAFAHTIAVLQDADALHRVAREAIEDLAADGVVHAELRFAPTLHTAGGLSADGVLEAVLAGLRDAARDADMSYGLIACAMRNAGDSAAVAELAVRWHDRGVVALDLAGPEHGWPAAMHRDAFLCARSAGLRVTVHAGEASGVASVAQALHLCGAERLGHGVRVIDDIAFDRDGAATLGPLARLIRDRRVPLEVCPTSNVQTGAAASLVDHPVGRLLALGFAVTISADNRLMSGVGAADELARTAAAQGWGTTEMLSVQAHAADAAFVDPDRRARLHQLVRTGADH